MTYDAMLVLAIWLVTLFIGVAVHNGPVLGPLVQTILFVELFSFFAYFWVWRGQTVGMLAWSLRIETDDGTPMRLGQALLRFVGAMLVVRLARSRLSVDLRRSGPPRVAGHAVAHARRAPPDPLTSSIANAAPIGSPPASTPRSATRSPRPPVCETPCSSARECPRDI